MVEKLLVAIGALVSFALVIALASVLLTFPVMWLTNYLFTSTMLIAVFGTAKIGFWQALCLSTLCSSLFKSSTSSK